jgi:hypothetical protein
VKAPWSSYFQLKDLDEENTWDGIPPKPGIYVVKSGLKIQRLAGSDDNGILYIGKSMLVKNRIYNFYDIQQHPASDMLWQYPKLAATIFKKPCRTTKKVENLVGELYVRISTPIPRGQLGEAERAVLFAYFEKYHELPPLNSNFPERWKKAPRANLRRWANRGIS